MSHRNYFQLLTSIGHNRGGLTKAIYDRSNALSESEIAPIFVLPFLQTDAKYIFDQIQSGGKLSKCKFISLYEHLSSERGNDGERATPLNNFDELRKSAQSVVEQHPNGKTIRYFKDGVFFGAESYTSTNQLVAITYHDPREPWKPLARDTFNSSGGVVTRTYLDTTFSARYRIYYSHSGLAILSHWISPAEKNYRFITYASQGSTKQFDSLEDLQFSWLTDCVKQHSPEFMISDEAATLPFLRLKNTGTKAIAAIHTTHVKDQAESREYKAWFPQYCKMQSSVDKFVFFTNAQKNDFSRDAKIPLEKCIVISHPAPSPIQHAGAKTGLVTVSRLDKFKRLDDSIKAFSLISEKHPTIHYDIYGTGPEEASLKELISSLKLQNRVSIHGYTDTPLECFAGAKLSLFTSRYEGFGLTLLESLVQECPVIAYEVEYGPIEILKNNINGILVKNGDIEALSNAIDKILSDQEFLEKLSRNCRDVSETYSLQNWKDGWQSLPSKLI